jgi:hypothetical protein
MLSVRKRILYDLLCVPSSPMSLPRESFNAAIFGVIDFESSIINSSCGASSVTFSRLIAFKLNCLVELMGSTSVVGSGVGLTVGVGVGAGVVSSADEIEMMRSPPTEVGNCGDGVGSSCSSGFSGTGEASAASMEIWFGCANGDRLSKLALSTQLVALVTKQANKYQVSVLVGTSPSMQFLYLICLVL